jgi:predicted MFS family arabinose efflux permease
MLVVPGLLSGDAAVWMVLVAWVAIAGMGALGNAAWTALSAELVPTRIRGGYFASRNMIMQFAQLLAIPIAGQLVNVLGEPGGYQVNFGVAFAVGAVSLYFYSRLPEHPPGPQADRLRTREVLRQMIKMPTFVRFVAAHAILMLGVMTAAPFINVYMAEKAGFSVGTIGLVTTVGVLAGLVGMRIMGRLHDRLGIIRTMRFGLGVPLIPVAWLWVHHPWQGYLVNSLSSLTWAGYNLGAFNLLLASTPDEHRPRYIAVYTTIVFMVGAIGPLLGGWLLDAVGYSPVFSLSGIVRALGLILFFALVREPDLVPEPEYAV